MTRQSLLALLAAGGAMLACGHRPSAPTERLLMPIEKVEVALMESLPVQGAVHVRGYLPDSCHTFAGLTQRRDGNAFTIELHMERRGGPGAVCLMRIEIVERTVALGALAPGDYTVTVNGIPRAFRVD